MNKIQKFLVDNSLSLDGYGSDLNSTCCIIAGFALYESKDEFGFEKLVEDITEDDIIDLGDGAKRELERVYDYAYSNNYYKWWEDAGAHTMYKF